MDHRPFVRGLRPLLNRATQLVYEGVPSHPDAGRMWRAVDKYEVTQLYTAPTASTSLGRADLARELFALLLG